MRLGRLKMSRLMPLLLAVPGLALAQADQKPPSSSGETRPLVLRVTLDDEPITPGVARYLHRAIRTAEERNAECLIVMLHTPGGLLDSTYDIVKDILTSRVCVVVYVWPPSLGRAGSAGVFITLASHVAAMAPGTRIGAAHPVPAVPGFRSPPPEMEPPGRQDASSEEGEPSDQHKRPAKQQPGEKQRPAGGPGEREGPSEKGPASFQDAAMEKVVNDTVGWARALAERRGRNADWAARAVRQSEVLLAREAIEQNVVDLGAADLEDLLEKLDGREVTLPQGPHTLRTSNADVQELPMSWTEQVLSAITRPNVTFLLLICGSYAILFELYSPGWGVFGTLGIICLLLAAGGLSLLPVNYLGLALIVAALALFTAEVFVTSFGLLTLGGIVCLVLGGLMLVDSPIGFERVSLEVVLPVAAATAFITLCLIGGIVRVHRRQVQTGDEALIGAAARARNTFRRRHGRYAGTVFVHGEWWTAASDAPLEAGQACQVDGRQGLTLIVKPSEGERSET
jgi:membrane-bound serine protease (ClpP class)